MFIEKKWNGGINVRWWMHNSRTIHGRHWCFIKDKFVLTGKGDINKFLGIEITHIDKKIFKLSQPFSIDSIISLLNIGAKKYCKDNNSKSTPVGKPLLHKYLSGKPSKEAWNYQTTVPMLNYLQVNSHPDMSMAVHQTSCFCNNQILSHEKSIKLLGRYL